MMVERYWIWPKIENSLLYDILKINHLSSYKFLKTTIKFYLTACSHQFERENLHDSKYGNQRVNTDKFVVGAVNFSPMTPVQLVIGLPSIH